MMKLYTQTAVDSFVFGKLAPMGYEIHAMQGTLADGYICISPDDAKFHFVAQERYVNAWTSGVSVRRCRRLPQWALDYIAKETEEDA